MNTTSYWLDDKSCGDWPRLDEDIATDVLVIGGGITGITTATLLAKRGLDVVLIERDGFALRDTGHTTAHLTYMTDRRLSELVASFGKRDALLSWKAGVEAMEMIASLAEEEGISCGLRSVPGYLVSAAGSDLQAERHQLLQEVEFAREGGFPVGLLEEAPVTRRPGILFSGQMEFHPLHYLRGLLQVASRKGVRIFSPCEAGAFEAKRRRVKAGDHWIHCGKVVIATHVPLQGDGGALGAALFQTKLALYSTYAVGARIPTGRIPEMIWSDTGDPFLYLRVHQDGDSSYVILGGGDHRTGLIQDTGHCYSNIEKELKRLIPEAGITHRWSGQVVEPVDGLPFIGPSDDWQFIATGFSGNGMTFGTLAAMMAAEWVDGGATPWDTLFSPGRKTVSRLKNYLQENMTFAKVVTDRLTVRKGDPGALKPGEGKVMMHGGHCTAASRDASGELHLCSPVCPHLGCHVAWNSAEETWDCPCHGSRFTAEGQVIAGPAEEDLKRYLPESIAQTTPSSRS